MNDIIEKKTNRLNVETYHAYQEVRYRLKAQNTDALTLYHREDRLRSEVNRTECCYLQRAYGRYSRKLKIRQEEKKEKSKDLGLPVTTQPRKKKISIHDVAKQVKRKIAMNSKTSNKRQRKQ